MILVVNYARFPDKSRNGAGEAPGSGIKRERDAETLIKQQCSP